MTSSVASTVARSLLAVGIALAATACGGDPAGGQMSGGGPPPGAKPAAAKAAAKPGAAVQVVVQRAPNPRWETIRPYFDKFVNQPLLTHKDTFRDNLVRFVPKVDLPALEPPTEELPVVEDSGPAVEDVTAGPLERYSSEEYMLVMIMSGTVVPKALVIDPIGNAWVVQKDARFGNKNGIIQNITQYAMIIQEPDKDGPLEKTIKPAIFDVAVDIMAGGDGEQRLTAAPIVH